MSVVSVVLASLVFSLPVRAETLESSSIEERIVLGFSVNEEAAKNMLPEGWTPLTLSKGGFTGSNLLLVFMDRKMLLEADGKPMEPSANPAAAILVYGINPDFEGVRTFITRVYETPPLVNPYDNSEAAVISRVASTNVTGVGPNTHAESWRVVLDDGGVIAFSMEYTIGAPSWILGSMSEPHSAVNPDYYRIFRFDQLVELAMNTAIGKPLNGKVSYEVSDAKLADAFDGSESLVAIMNIPVYLRQIYMP